MLGISMREDHRGRRIPFEFSRAAEAKDWATNRVDTGRLTERATGLGCGCVFDAATGKMIRKVILLASLGKSATRSAEASNLS
jgi:hypothetical protein